MDALKLISQDCLRADKPEVAIGDTVKVYCKIKEGDHYRTQIFEGAVIAKQHGGISESFTVHSPMIEKVELVRHGRVRRAKLYYLRDRVGKAAKVKQVR